MEKGVQVSVKSGKIVKKDIDSQTDLSSFHVKNAKIQCGRVKLVTIGALKLHKHDGLATA